MIPPNEDIKTYFDEGEIGEKLLLPIIKRKYPSAYTRKMGDAINKDGDIIIPEIHCELFDDVLKIEVKTYSSVIKNNNVIWIEQGYNNNPSGIKTTKSKYWCIIYPDMYKFWLIHINMIKDLINEYSTIKDSDGAPKFFKYVLEDNTYLNTAILHYPNFRNTKGALQDVYLIPVPLFQLYSMDYGKLCDFNIDLIM